MRDDHSGDLIGAGGERRSDWPAHVLANDVGARIDRLHACRHKWQIAATDSGGRDGIAYPRHSLNASSELCPCRTLELVDTCKI